MKSPEEVVDLIIQSEEEARKQIWLIPSENIPSPFSRLALATSAVNRYFFAHDYKGGRFCPGSEIYQELYDYCVEVLKRLFKAEYVSLRPISGMNAMTMVITTYTDKDDMMCSLSPDVGGHTHTEKIAKALGRKVCHVPMFDEGDMFRIDYDKLEKDLRQIRPRLLYLDPMSYPYQFDTSMIREITPRDCALHYDTSHVMSFVAGGIYRNALDADYSSIGGSTHKTLPSVQKGFFATNKKEYWEKFERYSGQLLSSLHASSVLGLAVTLSETINFYENYAQNTLENARFCCECLENAGFHVLGPAGRKTDCHVVFHDVEPHCDPVEASYRLARANIITHPIKLPVKKPRKAMRLGLQELTVLGMGKAEVEMVVNVFKKVLIDNEDPKKFAKPVSDLRAKFRHPTSSYWNESRLMKLVDAILR